MRYIYLTAVLLLLAACGDWPTEPTTPTTSATPVATSIILSATSLSFSSIGVTQQLTATVRDQNAANMSGATVTWTTSDAAVATVSSTGLVTSIADGTATITATSGALTGTAAVTVAQVAANLVLSDSTLTFASLASTTQLTATVTDANGETVSGATVTWTTSSSSVATVSSAGLVTAVAAGLASITATAGTLFASAQVTVLPLSVTYGSLPAGFTSTPYTHTLEASGGNGSYEWLMISGALPLGLTLSTGGTISGTPTVTGESTFSFEVRSGDGQAATAQRSITVKDSLQITTTSLPSVMVNSSYDQTLAAFGGDSPYTWSVITGSLPNGLSLSPANGQITGTATTVGSSTFTLQARSTDGQTVSKEFTISVYGPLVITTASVPNAITGNEYSVSFGASGGDGNYTWSIYIGQLPSGLSLSVDGTISGTPTVTGESTFSVEVRSGDGQAATAQRSITVKDPLQITTTSLPGVLVNSSYNQTLAAFGGDSPYTWSVITGSLPNGLSLSPANGQITGTVTTVGSSTFTLQVRSTDGQTVSKEFTISVYGPLIITTASMPNAITGNEYSVSFGASGGDGNYTWSLSYGSLPSGLSLSLDGTISGTPTSAGVEYFTVQVTSGDGQSERTSLFSIDVFDLLEITSTSPLPSGTVGSSYSGLVNATGGDYPYSWSISSGSLPAGLYLQNYSLDYDRISGTPETAGTSTFTIKVTSEGQTATKEFTMTINP